MRIQGIDGVLIWLDPGWTTGHAMLSRAGDFLCGQHVGVCELSDWLDGLAPYWGPNVMLGWEAYQAVGARSAKSTYGLRVMGAAEWIAHRHDWQPLDEVPSSMRTVATVGALRQLGWYRKGQPHAMDAARHLLAHIMRTGIAPDIVRRAFTEPENEQVASEET